MKEFIKYPSTKDFKTIVHEISKKHEDSPPTISFVGTVKVHGTNGSVCYSSSSNDMWVQSRERIITPEGDNFGFAGWVELQKEKFNSIFERVLELYGASASMVQLCGEWAGRGVQKNVGVSFLDKKFFVFGIRTISLEGEEEWLDLEAIEKVLPREDKDVISITSFKLFGVDIDFSNPTKIQNTLFKMVQDVENDCPVARALLGDTESELVGEGIVFTAVTHPFNSQGLRFKVKGEKHSNSKVKNIVAINPEKVASIAEYVDNHLTTNRLEQGLQKLEEMGLSKEIKNIGVFIKWCVNDTLKECSDVLEVSGLTSKDVTGELTRKAREYYLANR